MADKRQEFIERRLRQMGITEPVPHAPSKPSSAPPKGKAVKDAKRPDRGKKPVSRGKAPAESVYALLGASAPSSALNLLAGGGGASPPASPTRAAAVGRGPGGHKGASPSPRLASAGDVPSWDASALDSDMTDAVQMALAPGYASGLSPASRASLITGRRTQRLLERGVTPQEAPRVVQRADTPPSLRASVVRESVGLSAAALHGYAVKDAAAFPMGGGGGGRPAGGPFGAVDYDAPPVRSKKDLARAAELAAAIESARMEEAAIVEAREARRRAAQAYARELEGQAAVQAASKAAEKMARQTGAPQPIAPPPPYTTVAQPAYAPSLTQGGRGHGAYSPHQQTAGSATESVSYAPVAPPLFSHGGYEEGQSGTGRGGAGSAVVAALRSSITSLQATVAGLTAENARLAPALARAGQEVALAREGQARAEAEVGRLQGKLASAVDTLEAYVGAFGRLP